MRLVLVDAYFFLYLLSVNYVGVGGGGGLVVVCLAVLLEGRVAFFTFLFLPFVSLLKHISVGYIWVAFL